MSSELETYTKTLDQLKTLVKGLPLNERKQAAMLYSIYEEIVRNKEAEKKETDEAYDKYSEDIVKWTTEMDTLIEGTRKVNEEEIKYWKDNVEPEYVAKEEDNNQQPIKNFWRKFIENSGLYHSEKDFPMLDHISKVSISDETDKVDPKIRHLVLTLDFHDNDYFANKSLTCKLIYVGEVISKSEGTVIQWKKDNPTVKKTTKNQKNKRTGQTRTITKEVQLKSFFEIFSNYTDDEEKKGEEKHGKDNEEEESSMDLYVLEDTLNDFNDLMPYALEYYLGVAPADDDCDDDCDDCEEDEEEEDDDDEDDDAKGRHKHKKAKGKADSKKQSRKQSEAEKKDKPEGGPETKQECKQQ